MAGVASPSAGFEPASQSAVAYAHQIAASGAKICFVALGAPKQELFAAAALAEAPGVAFVCIGAGLDFLAGVQARAPRWVRAVGAEWLWRLLSNPWRLGRRYLACLMVLPSVLLSSVAAQRSTAAASS
jgi:exopolysaccharide biosynthesis WecB/TagA/CpsF family protein